jgi:hypothetical protein
MLRDCFFVLALTLSLAAVAAAGELSAAGVDQESELLLFERR